MCLEPLFYGLSNNTRVCNREKGKTTQSEPAKENYQALKVECLLYGRQIIRALPNNLVRLEWSSLFTDKEPNF